jgi:hypothetical protein
MMQWNLSQRAVTGLWETVISPIQDWLAQYPILVWLVSHPIWLLGVILLSLFLLAGLLRAVASLTEQLWLSLLRLPLTLVQLIWRGTMLLWRPLFTKSAMVQTIAPGSISPESISPNSSRLTEVLDRLEALRQEEQELMQEMKALLKAQNQD